MKEQSPSNSTINITMSFLDFPKAIQEKIHAGRLGLNAAKALHEASLNKLPEEWLAVRGRNGVFQDAFRG